MTPWGGYSGYFADPDGHLWEIAWNPGWPIAEDGSISLGRVARLHCSGQKTLIAKVPSTATITESGRPRRQ